MSPAPAEINLDVFNMRTIPSQVRTTWLNEIMDKHELLDPFRYLNPNMMDFSYSPYGTVRKNRSRIDFFLISGSFSDYIKKCEIAPGLCKKNFDHKSVFLQLGAVRKNGRKSVNNRIVGNPLFRLIVILAMYETYIGQIACVKNGIVDVILTNLSGELDTISPHLAVLLSLCDSWSWKPISPGDRDIRDVTLGIIDNILGNATTLEELSAFPKKVDDDVFFEILISNINRCVLGLQFDSVKSEKKKVNKIVSELGQLKRNYLANKDRILEQEDTLNRILEAELEDKVKNYIKSDAINDEKMSPRFLSMAKEFTNDSLTVICNDNEIEFNSERERGEYIRQFYARLYELPPDKPANLAGCVAEFLGPEISAHPTVLGTKLNAEERIRLDAPITLSELDNAIKKANKKSAPGIDGVSNVMIQKIWDLVRVPLLKYATCCFRKGTLTSTFKTACIKLIPKKGNTKEIKNWRPISLLSCYYKIISRVINTRLGTVIDKVTGRGQKAYNSKKYIHEVIINLTNNISYCKDNAIPGVIVSIDQSKAFDSIYNDFCNDAFRFFGFGETFIEMMSTLGTGRNAKIILENGKLSDPVQLHRGRPQGDSPSPRQYNIGEQICLLKLEFDPRIEPILPTQGVPRPLEHFMEDAKISNEVKNGSGNTEAFADDTNVSCRQKSAALVALKSILQDFSVISGLKCNTDKTCIMFIGPRDPVESPLIEELGFTIVEKMKILGLWIGPDGIIVDVISRAALAKIKQLIGCWTRFNLSLKGRIAISKTMLVSQVTYLGPVLTPENAIINEIQACIDNFVIRGMPVAADRKYIKPQNGGLGLIKIADLFDSMKCSWFKRISQDGINDNWRLSILKNCYGNITCFRPDQLNWTTNPIEHSIGMGFWNFLLSFWRCNHNFLSAPIVNNPIFIRGRGDNGRMDNNLVDELVIGRQCFNEHKQAWLNLKIRDLFANGAIITYENFIIKMGFPCTVLCYMHIRKAAIHAITKFNNNADSDKTCTTLENFLARKKKGSSSFRKILGMPRNGVAYKGMNIVRTFFNIINIAMPNCIRTGCSFLGIWNYSFWPVKISTFTYQLYNNSLPVAARTGNRYRNVALADIDERCFWCMSENFNVPGRETFSHVFFECPTTAAIYANFCAKFINGNSTALQKRLLIFFGMDEEEKVDQIMQIVGILLMFCIWEGKTRRKSLSYFTVECNMFFYFDNIIDNNKWLKSVLMTKDDIWCRYWRGRADSRRG